MQRAKSSRRARRLRILSALAGKMLASEATYAAAANCNVAAAAEEAHILFAQRATADNLSLAPGKWQAE
jgi:hypothetical protein